MIKKALTLIVSMILLFGLAACGDSTESSTDAASGSEKEVMKIKLGHVTNDQSAIHKGALKFKEIVEEKADGTMEVEVIPGGQLGSEKDLVESTQIGTIEITIPSAAVLSNFVPKAAVLTLPYVIKGENEREKYKTFVELGKSEAYKEIATQAEEAKLVAFPEAIWWVGDRHVTTSEEPVKTPEDMKGLKIRTPDATAHTEPFKIMDANVTPMNISEVYYSLKSGTIAAQENSVNQIYTNNFHEVQKYVNLTGHMSQNELPVVSLQWWNTLNEDQKKIVTEAMNESGEYMSELQLTANEEELEILKEEGMEVVEVDIEAFKEATKDTYKSFEDVLGKGYYEKIKSAQE
ncbi:TRAP transporter substrate-binding protein [Metabacillus halosaccharovorans]|uniref:TRAP transporter substrate-binding protein n=1 Tax=Metabacillus halosaccharovorans TaxID=930124 RepID=A0ABT3DBV2_9BACI|nr:TRAP transporter substrate-binding protein [Metabacillus halosaccharovorans]MCV9884417.1 TRAP transporter substrate-binding protein [Metabacillus halosaccharovorans]